MGGDGGVFLGIERPDWAYVQPSSARASVYAVTGDNVSAAAGRLSFVLGLQGPSEAFDAACASGLVALHAAAVAVGRGECGAAVALAVSLKLSPLGTLAFEADRRQRDAKHSMETCLRICASTLLSTPVPL